MNALEAIVRLEELRFKYIENANKQKLIQIQRQTYINTVNRLDNDIQTIKDNNPKWHSPTQQ